jgi:hypothetical protein
VLFAPFVGEIDAVMFPRNVDVVVLSTVCVSPAMVAFTRVTISVETAVMVLTLVLCGESVRVDVVVEYAVTSAGTLKIPAHVARSMFCV